MAQHLDPLRLSPAQRAAGPLEGEVTEAQGHERVEVRPQRIEQRPSTRQIQPAHPPRKVGDLHAARVGDAHPPVDLRRTRALREPGAVALRAHREGGDPLHEARMCGCSASMSFDSIDLVIFGIRPS